MRPPRYSMVLSTRGTVDPSQQTLYSLIPLSVWFIKEFKDVGTPWGKVRVIIHILLLGFRVMTLILNIEEQNYLFFDTVCKFLPLYSSIVTFLHPLLGGMVL